MGVWNTYTGALVGIDQQISVEKEHIATRWHAKEPVIKLYGHRSWMSFWYVSQNKNSFRLIWRIQADVSGWCTRRRSVRSARWIRSLVGIPDLNSLFALACLSKIFQAWSRTPRRVKYITNNSATIQHQSLALMVLFYLPRARYKVFG